MRETASHIYFWGTLLSNWAIGIFKVDGITYNCAEQFMMAEKAKTFNDKEMWTKIMKSKNPKEQKSLGRKVSGYKDEVWTNKRYQVVKRGIYSKFSQVEEAREFLKKTGNKTLVEASPYDRIWGVGLHFKDEKILDERNWQGQNLLGKALMEVRNQIFGETDE